MMFFLVFLYHFKSELPYKQSLITMVSKVNYIDYTTQLTTHHLRHFHMPSSVQLKVNYSSFKGSFIYGLSGISMVLITASITIVTTTPNKKKKNNP